MDGMVSTIKKIDFKREEIFSFVVLNRLSPHDQLFLEGEFGLSKEKVDFFVSNYRHIGLVFKLVPIQPEYARDWAEPLIRGFKDTDELSKFQNVFVARDAAKILLVTNKRMLKVDLDTINETLMDVNMRIEHTNDKVEKEFRHLADVEKSQKGIFGRMMEALKK